MPPKTRAGKARALLNLKQNRRTHAASGAFTEPSNAAVATLKAELEAGLRLDRGLEDGRPLPVMDQVRLVVLAGKLAKLKAMDAAGSVDRWLRLAPNHARVSSRIPGYVTAWQHLNESCLSLAAELGLTVRDQVRAGGRVIGFTAQADNELRINVRYQDDWRDKPTVQDLAPEAPPASTDTQQNGSGEVPAIEDVFQVSDALEARDSQDHGLVEETRDGDPGPPPVPTSDPPEADWPPRIGGWPWG